ncbi:MAG TPA: PAS domain-containing protein [Coriobacteriia bacterium]
MMPSVASAGDVIALIAFAAAIPVVFSIPGDRRSPFSAGAKLFVAGGVVAHAVVMLGDILVSQGVASLLEPIEGAVELLWVPLIAFAVYSLYSRQQMLDATTAQHGALRANEMLETIVDTAPAGIVLLDGSGALTFANQAARHLLDLEKDGTAAEGATLGFTVTLDPAAGEGSRLPGMRALIASGKLAGAEALVEWPNGWRRRLSVNTAPETDADGCVTGVVVAFVEAEPWKTVGPR